MAILSGILGAVLVIALWIPAGSDEAIFVFAVFYGIPLGCFAAAIPLLVAQISDVRQIGVRVGATFFLNGFAGLTGNPIAGALARRATERSTSEYLYLKLFCGLTIAIGLCFFIATRVCHGGFRLFTRA